MVTLEEAIQQQVNLGARDPQGIYEALERQFGNDELLELVRPYLPDLLTEMARRRLTAHRRSAEVALRLGDHRSQAQIRLAKAWIPGSGWKRADELTAEDLRLRAAAYDSLANASLVRAQWCREVASMIEEDGVQTLGQLRRELPALPTTLELEAA